MATNEEGEFELILGNKQLLSVFFIVVVLLGVFFTMGYIVGKNSPGMEIAGGKQNPMVIDPSGPARKEPTGGLVVEPARSGGEVTSTPSPEPSRVPCRPTPAPTPAPTPRPTASPTPPPVAPVKTPS